MERQGALISVLFVGGDSRSWVLCLAGLGICEFHLYDRDVPPATEDRQRAAEIVNRRPNCRAVLTCNGTLENYLHADAIFEVSGLQVEFSDHDDVADLVASHQYGREEDASLAWAAGLHVKTSPDQGQTLLHTASRQCMTIGRLASQDPGGEIRSWLTTIVQLASNRS